MSDTPWDWWVYVARCFDQSLYTGTTTDVERRIKDHNTSSRGAKYTRSRRPVFAEVAWGPMNKSMAHKLEAAFKRQPKVAKEAMLLLSDWDVKVSLLAWCQCCGALRGRHKTGCVTARRG